MNESCRFSCTPLGALAPESSRPEQRTFSQTFPLMDDETVGLFVCVMSVAVFELWRYRRDERGAPLVIDPRSMTPESAISVGRSLDGQSKRGNPTAAISRVKAVGY